MTTSCISMNIGRLALMAVGLLAGSLSQAAEPPPAKVEAKVGEKFTIKLPANHSTGYSWNLAVPLEEGVVEKVGNDYVVPPQDPQKPRVGVGGEEVWSFKALKQGKVLLTFHYTRPWEKDKEPGKTARHEVVVK